MKKSFFACLVLFAAASAWGTQHPINSLNDIPSKWAGAAGNLFEKVNGSFSFANAVQTKRENSQENFRASYKVDGQLKIGSQTYTVKSVDLEVWFKYRNQCQLVLHLDSDFVSNLWLGVRRDKAGAFSMKEINSTNGGERRIVFNSL